MSYTARTITDILNDPCSKRAHAANEEGFRRGYCHGYGRALDDFLDVMKRLGFARPKEAWNILVAHFDDALTPWRYRSSEWFPPGLKQEHWHKIRRAVFARDGRVCALCSSTTDLKIDHIREVKDGGLPVLDNLRVLCGSCNRRRNRAPRARKARR